MPGGQISSGSTTVLSQACQGRNSNSDGTPEHLVLVIRVGGHGRDNKFSDRNDITAEAEALKSEVNDALMPRACHRACHTVNNNGGPFPIGRTGVTMGTLQQRW
jgi:hypothetical protein